MVDLEGNGYPSMLQALHQPDFPQWAIQIQRHSHQVGQEIAELLLASRGWKCDVINVVVSGKVGIGHPHRVVEIERYAHDPQGGGTVDGRHDDTRLHETP